MSFNTIQDLNNSGNWNENDVDSDNDSNTSLVEN